MDYNFEKQLNTNCDIDLKFPPEWGIITNIQIDSILVIFIIPSTRYTYGVAKINMKTMIIDMDSFITFKL